MPVEFTRNDACIDIHEQIVCGSMKLVMAYDGSGRRISKTRMRDYGKGVWETQSITHYTGIDTEIRENFSGESPETKVVVNMPVFFRVTLTRLKPRSYIEKDILRLSNGGAILPKRSFGASRQGLGRYGIENTDGMAKGDEFYLKNHLGSTMMVAQVSSTNASEPAKVAAAYDYRAFGEQVTLKKSADKVTENFTGKELDDETELDYFGARYLDPMLGLWISVDPARQFASPYLYAGNGYNPVNGVDPDGNFVNVIKNGNNLIVYVPVCFTGNESYKQPVINAVEKNLSDKFGKYTVSTQVVEVPYSERENANMVALLDGNERSEVRNFGTQESQADIYMKNADDTYAAVHEFAHLLGLDDRYTNNDDGTSSAHKGYGANLMGVHGEYGIKEEQIEEIFKGPGSAGNYIDE